MPHYTGTWLKISGSRSYRVMNPNLKFLIEILVNTYEGNQ